MCIMIAVEGSHGLLVRSVGIVLEQSLTFQHVLQKKLRVDQFEYRRRPVVPIPQAICVAGMDLLELAHYGGKPTQMRPPTIDAAPCESL